MTPIYILIARGPCINFRQNKLAIPGKTAYRTRDKAEADIEGLKKRCTTPKDDRDLFYIDPEMVEVNVIELQLED